MLMSLRITILALIASLLVLTVGTIGGLGYYLTNESVDDLRDQYLQAVSEGVAQEIDALIQPAFPLLSLIRIPQDLSAEVTPQETNLIHELAEHVKTISALTYLNYGDQKSGHYIAIRRDETGRLIFNRAHPLVDSGHEFEWLLLENGALSPLPQPQTPPYDPRGRDWYTLAAEKGFTWTKPYSFFSGGGKGISASLPIKNSDGTFRGVISLAISLDQLSQYLKSIRKNSNVDIFVSLPDGSLVASSAMSEDSNSAVAFRAALRKARKGVELIPEETKLISDATHDDPYSVTFYPFTRNGFLLWSIAVVIPENTYMGIVTQNTYMTLTVGLLALALALGAGYFISDRIATPLRKISYDLEKIARFNLTNDTPPPSFIEEIAIVGDAVSRMKAGLRSFSRFVPHDVVRKILSSGHEIGLGGEIRELTLHFSDLANFSTFCEDLSPTEVVRNLAEYLEIMTNVLHEYNGTVIQYTGDGLFSFFNAPIIDKDHATNAVSSALIIQQKLAEANKRRTSNGLFQFNNRIGLHTAEVVVGNIGTEKKLAYSAIGDGVNLASRLEGLNKIYGTAIIASAAVHELTADHYLWRRLDKVAVFGRAAPTVIYEPIRLLESATDDERNACALYEAALQEYFSGQFRFARDKFAKLTDSASKKMCERCEDFLKIPPSPEWDGTFNPSGK